MLKVLIKAPPNSNWSDHARNKINELVFSKKNESQYKSGHYALESYGKLDRTIEDFRKSPLQSQSDWSISIPSVFSSKDGSFKTIDLLYFLEWVNEEANKNFDLTGCEAILYDDDNPLFKCVVTSTATTSLRSDIRFSESLGNPEIIAGDFSTAVGGASVDRWKVLIQKEQWGYRIVPSDTLLSDMKFSIYSEKRNEFVPVVGFYSDKKTESIPKRSGNEYLLWFKNEYITGCGKDNIKLENKSIYIKLESDEISPNSIDLSKFRQSFDSEEFHPPNNLQLGDNNYFGQVQVPLIAEAWSSYPWSWLEGAYPSTSDFYYSLGSINNFSLNFGNSGLVNIYNINDEMYAKCTIEVPVADVATVVHENYLFDENHYHNWSKDATPLTKGSPQALREFSQKGNSIDLIREDEWEKFPMIKFKGYYHLNNPSLTNVILHLTFPDLDVPNESIVTGARISVRVRGERFELSRGKNGGVLLVKSTTSSPIDASVWHTKAIPSKLLNPEISAWREIDVHVVPIEYTIGVPADSWIQIAGIRLSVDVLIPIDKVKALYVEGTPFNPSQPGEGGRSGETIKDSVKTLLNKAGVADFEVKTPENFNDAVKYGTVLSRNTTLRDKLRSLAAETWTLIKFSPSKGAIELQSVSRAQPVIKPKFIDISAFVLSNNMYSFKMESPHRGDIASEVVISWGRNTITDKYEHTFKVNSSGAYKDGSPFDLNKGYLKGKWDSVIRQLEKQNGLGTTKNIDTEWIINLEGAEIMAYNYLCWNCAPLRKAQAECITSMIPPEIDIGSFVSFALPGYPPKFAETTWVVTGIQNDLDAKTSSLELLEAWDIPAVPPNRFLLLENGKNILLENSEKIKLEGISNG